MSLFKRIVNEALDEDLSLKRKYIENVKKAQEEFGSVAVFTPLDASEKFALDRAILSLEESINNYSDYREKDIPEFSINTVQSKYNALALLLERIGYPNLQQKDLLSIQKQLDAILPTLVALKSEVDANPSSSRVTKDIIDGIVINFKSKSYKPLGIFGFEAAIPAPRAKKIIRRTFKQLKKPLDDLITALVENQYTQTSQEYLAEAERYRRAIESQRYSNAVFNEIAEFIRFVTEQLGNELEAM